MRYDTDHKARTRERILDEAASAIRAAGPQGVSVGGLMKKAGLTHGGFYAHFGSKDDLVAEAIGHMFGGPYANFAALTDLCVTSSSRTERLSASSDSSSSSSSSDSICSRS